MHFRNSIFHLSSALNTDCAGVVVCHFDSFSKRHSHQVLSAICFEDNIDSLKDKILSSVMIVISFFKNAGMESIQFRSSHLHFVV